MTAGRGPCFSKPNMEPCAAVVAERLLLSNERKRRPHTLVSLLCSLAWPPCPFSILLLDSSHCAIANPHPLPPPPSPVSPFPSPYACTLPSSLSGWFGLGERDSPPG
ncbi:hypothetical protein IF1G_00525 [Cordyceps javanica]|uniref:Uncharacterized protein n=1 Tax=Cordyceps javanica TaxID=43265 RepID=A0A545VFT3_9HYPO|nr:hypothetical protein IF1G_00525 [Cordyceps javanica]